MPGGGIWLLAPGQITDDSELAMCQLRGLVAGNGKFDPFHLARYYGYWVSMWPFDIGQTTQNGLKPLGECRDNPNPKVSYQAAKRGPGAKSMSNGSLMRVSPLAVWAHKLTMEDLERAVKADVSFMHSKKEMADIVTAYCLAIGTLIKNAGQTNRAQLALDAV